MRMYSYDVIIVGAGSIGVPTAMSLAKLGVKTLVIDAKSSPGQGENKKAIGGIRATHSDPAKITLGKSSLEVFSTWEQLYGDKIEWTTGGYVFPVYRSEEELILKNLLPIQHKFGLEINFVDSIEIKRLIPGINEDSLLGGIFSPNDGSASPLLSINAFAKQAVMNGAEFKFKEHVNKILLDGNKVAGIETDKNKYIAPVIVDAVGASSPEFCKMVGFNIKMIPELHEAAITEPIKRFFRCMIVDLRAETGSKNFYLYQNIHGQIIFCITPDPPIIGSNSDETSTFLPQVCKRILNLIPSLHNVRVRRMWRGCYPMTPDGSPIVGWNKDIFGLFHLTGMCGQGFMLGPGVGELASRIITKNCTEFDSTVQKNFSPYRKFYDSQETLK